MATPARPIPRERVRPSGPSDRTLALLLVLPTAILLLAFSVYPFMQAAWDSFFRIPLATRAGEFVGWENYRGLIEEESVRDAFRRTLVWTAANVVVQAGLGLLIALVLNAKLHGQDLARGLVLFPYMVPAVVIAAVFRFNLNDLTGIVNYVWTERLWGERPILFLADPDLALLTVTMINCWKYTPFMVIVLLARLQTVPSDLYEAARIDGANAL